MTLPSQIEWPTAEASVPALADGTIHVWAAEFRDWAGRLEELQCTLSAEEQQRAESYRHPDRRAVAVITRSLLRILLGRYCAVAPAEITFTYGLHGKPSLACPAKPIHFNASHSNEIAALAFTTLGEVGVDVEVIRTETPRLAEISTRFFSPHECETLRNLPEAERAQAFFRCWTRKEAFLKARGDGVFGGLSMFDVSIEPERATLLRCERNDIHQWWMAPLEGLRKHAGAVAVHAPRAALSCWKLTTGY